MLFSMFVIIILIQSTLFKSFFFSISMQNRISEMEQEEVDYLRFDRIKIQRKRMEHILEVIKDLSFKNKQLFKENAALKEERLHQGHYEKLYRELASQKIILMEKNIQLSSEVEKYRETVLHQQILINSLKQELYGENLSNYRSNLYDVKADNRQNIEKEQYFSQQYRILQAQYQQLKKEYSQLYKNASNNQKFSHKKNLNSHFEDLSGGKQNYSKKALHSQFKNHQASISRPLHCEQLSCHCEQDHHLILKLKQKYDKCKRSKKELSNQVKILRDSINSYQLRQKRHVELIEVLKEKKTKICICHLNKLNKKLSQTMFEFGDVSLQPTSHN